MDMTQLRQLGGYLHQDWPLDHADAESAVRAFVADRSPDEVAEALAEVEHLRTTQGDDELTNVLTSVIDYWPPGDGLTFRQWIDQLVNLLRESL